VSEITGTAFTVEGQTASGEWHSIGNQVPDADMAVVHRTEVRDMLRQHGITRYKKLRIRKTVTTTWATGQEVEV
jgi:hypothetical protein